MAQNAADFSVFLQQSTLEAFCCCCCCCRCTIWNCSSSHGGVCDSLYRIPCGPSGFWDVRSAIHDCSQHKAPDTCTRTRARTHAHTLQPFLPATHPAQLLLTQSASRSYAVTIDGAIHRWHVCAPADATVAGLTAQAIDIERALHIPCSCT